MRDGHGHGRGMDMVGGVDVVWDIDVVVMVDYSL